MKQTPILMCDTSVIGILTCAKCGKISVPFPCEHCGSKEFRKTQTRRVVSPQPIDMPQNGEMHGDTIPALVVGGKVIDMSCPYGGPGDLLLPREAWRALKRYDKFRPTQIPADAPIQFAADEYIQYAAGSGAAGKIEWGKWRPSIFMLKDYRRLWLAITKVRAQRLQRISGPDALSEGCTVDAIKEWLQPIASKAKTEPLHWIHGIDNDAAPYCYSCASKRVKALRRKPENKGKDILVDGGWGGEEDGIQHCEDCGVILEASLTRYGASQEMEYHDESGIYPTNEGVYHFYDMLDSGDVPDTEDDDEVPGFTSRVARIGYRWLWDRLNAAPKPAKRNPYTMEREDCYVSYPWEDVRKVEDRRGKKHYIVGNPFVFAISFSRTQKP